MRLSRVSSVNRKWNGGAALGRLAVAACASVAGVSGLVGCSDFTLNPLDTKSWIDPSEVSGRVKKDTLVVPILDTIDPREEPRREFVTAQPPTQDDLAVSATDYVISKNDLLSLEIADLQGPGTQTVKTTRVSETGNISLPFIGQIKAEGRTEFELEQDITATYKRAQILEKAVVQVTVAEARGRAINITGAVNRPGQYALIDPDFRVLDALTLAGDPITPLIQDLYIIRRTDLNRPSGKSATSPAGPGMTAPATRPAGGGVDDLRPQSSTGGTVDPLPRSRATRPAGGAKAVALAPLTQVQQSPAQSTGRPAAERPVLMAEESTTTTLLAQAAPAGGTDEAGRYTIIDGKKIYIETNNATAAPAAPAASAPAPVPAPAPGADPTPTPAASPAPAAPPAVVPADPTPAPAGATGGGAAAGTADRSGFSGFRDLTAPDNVRVIHIPLERLRNGELQYNVVVKPRDTIIVQNLPTGEYYMMGHVGSPGAYTLSQRKMTLSQAVASARMLDQLAIPERTDIVRRLPGNRQIFVRVNLTKIMDGEAPDIYLKPDDQVRVGTNAIAPFLAAIRGAFRFTYGFGFLYDRNFAAEENNKSLQGG